MSGEEGWDTMRWAWSEEFLVRGTDVLSDKSHSPSATTLE